MRKGMPMTKKDKRRLLIWSLLILVIGAYLSVFAYRYWTQILENNRDRDELKQRYQTLLNEERSLNVEVTRLQDPEFVARFARERFLYSREGERIIKIAD